MSRAFAYPQLSSRPQALRAAEPGPNCMAVKAWVPALQDRARALFPAGMTLNAQKLIGISLEGSVG